MVKLKCLWHNFISSRSSTKIVRKLKLLTNELSQEAPVDPATPKIDGITLPTPQVALTPDPAIQDLFETTNHMVNQIVEMARENAKQAFVVEHVTMAIEELSMAALKTAEASDNALTFAEGAREKAELGHATVNEMNEVMNLLTTSQKRIVDIGNQIRDIAKESKLISINAMLEASRAGQAGAGFMVVARKTQELSGNVAEHLNSIQTVIHESHEHAELNQKKASLVSLSLETIREGSSVTSDSMRVLNATIAGQSKTLSELSNMTVGVKTRVQEISIKLETATKTLLNTLRDLRKRLGLPEDKPSEQNFDFLETNTSSNETNEKRAAPSNFDEF